MNEAFKVYIEQLRDGHTEIIDEKVSPDFLDVREKDLEFVDPVIINGEAYLADNTLVLHLHVETFATIPCSICNKPAKVKIFIEDFYHAEPTLEIKSGIFNFQEVLRESILLDIPLFVECNQGNCPQRDEVKKYFKSSNSSDSEDEDRYHPFANLNLDK